MQIENIDEESPIKETLTLGQLKVHQRNIKVSQFNFETSQKKDIDQHVQKNSRERMYYADWIRVTAVHIVIFVHCLLNAADTTGLNDLDAIQKKEGICKCMSQVGMPLFFYISGISSTFQDAEKDGFLFYFQKQVKRLLVPMFFSMIFLLVPRLYLSQEYEPWTRIDESQQPENNIFVYLINILPKIFGKLSWLWFLIVLFEVMILNYSIIVWSQRRLKGSPFDIFIDGKLILILGITIGIWYLICQQMVSEEDLPKLINSIIVLVWFYLFMFIAQFLFKLDSLGPKFAFFAKFAGPIFCIIMNNFKKGQWENSMYGFLIGVNYFAIFHAQGLIDQHYQQISQQFQNELSNSIIAPFSVGIWYFIYTFTCPTNHSDTGFLFYYPIYFKFAYQSLYSTGSWQWLHTLLWAGKNICNKKFDEKVYDLVIGSSMWAYISHYLFIVIIANYIVRKFQFGYELAVLINFFGTQVFIFISYLLIQAIKKRIDYFNSNDKEKEYSLKIINKQNLKE